MCFRKYKKAQSNRTVKRVRAMCQDSFPQAVKSELHKLSHGKTVDVISMGEQEEHVFLKIEPRRKKLTINDMPGELTKITEGTFYGSTPSSWRGVTGLCECSFRQI
jgi:hypothetical protein